MKTGKKNYSTVEKTLRTGLLIDGFWDRWLVHGIDPNDLSKIRLSLTSEENWVSGWSRLADEKRDIANRLQDLGRIKEAELMYRTASLYYNLTQWLFPGMCPQKHMWYGACLQAIQQADSLSAIKTEYAFIEVDGYRCEGRIRIPDHPVGCVIIVNPIDSSKEELFMYEEDFLNAGFVTISFDGPGQGESFVHNGLKGSRERWEMFIDTLVAEMTNVFPQLPFYLFGTSLGGSWAIYAGRHPKVLKAVAVSPVAARKHLNFPGYFDERMDSVLICKGESPVPFFENIAVAGSLTIFHGKRDQMMTSEWMYRLFEMLSGDKKLIEYQDEGHCCNFRLSKIRQLAINWFLGKDIL